MAVDADGSPVSRGTNPSSTDRPRSFLVFDRGSNCRYANAEEVPFAVVPRDNVDSGSDFQPDSGLRRGDLAVMIRGKSCAFGVVGDAGAHFRLGEGSLRAHEELGNPQCAAAGQRPCRRLKGGGSGAGIPSGVTYLLFPGTRPAPLISQTAVPMSHDAAKARLAVFLQRFVRATPPP